ncbi:MAG: glutamyl-tRNA reductase [Planctomycetota bacterium]|jgi:glutamyl-tRNA reductase
MKIIVVGLNHKSAPVNVRERLAFDSIETLKALRQLKSKFPESEFVLLSTCNRVELYSANRSIGGIDSEAIIKFISEFKNFEIDRFKEFLYVYEDAEAVSHLLTVTSSLDSMVVGESQIIGQVKEGYTLACSAKSTGKVLNRLFHSSFSTGKKVHTTTSISSGRVSVAGVAVDLAKQLFADISASKVVVIGAGEMGELLVQHLLHIGCKNVVIVNRSYERGLKLANHYDIEAQKWDELEDLLTDASIVIASATVQDYLFKKDSFKKIINKRREGTLLIIDIAVPRNFEPSVNEIEDVYLYSIDDLSEVVEQNCKAREKDIARGMHIVYKAVTDFMEWLSTEDIGPLIGKMREKFGQISQEELQRFFVGTRQEASCRDVMEPMVKRIVNRLLHCVIKNVNIVAQKHGTSEAAKIVDSIVRQADEILSESDNKKNAET